MMVARVVYAGRGEYPFSEMTDSAVQDPPAGKRERLVAAACRVLHEQGVERTTLADIALTADVPVGNVYYYFKTKDQLVEAAIKAHGSNLEAMLSALDRRRTPQRRLKGLVHLWMDQRDLAARYGCPFGTLACELDKRTDGLDRTAAEVLGILTDWAERQGPRGAARVEPGGLPPERRIY